MSSRSKLLECNRQRVREHSIGKLTWDTFEISMKHGHPLTSQHSNIGNPCLVKRNDANSIDMRRTLSV